MIPNNTTHSIFSSVLGAFGNSFDIQIGYFAFSLLVSVIVFIFAKIIIQTKLSNLKGSSKLLGLVSVGIAGGEIMYLGLNFGMFSLAIEFIAYLGLGLWILLIPFQTYLKNMASGISNYMNTEIDIGDIIEIKGKKGVIVEFHLTKTILLTENGEKISVPNHRFHEDVMIISPKNSESQRKIKQYLIPKTKKDLFKN